MIHWLKAGVLGAVATVALGLPAAAQTVALGTTQGGATSQIATAIANVVSAAGEVQVRPQVSANTSQYIPLVNAGRLDFGIANYPQTWYAVDGSGMSSAPNPDLRVVATLFPFQAGIVAPESAGIASYADVAGKKVPRFPDGSLGDYIIRMALSAGGLTYEDVTEVPIANFPRMYDAIKQGQTDISIATIGSQPTYDLEAALGDIQFIPFDADDTEAVSAVLPGTYLWEIDANEELPGLDAPTRVFAYDYLLFAHKDVPDEIVTKVAKAMAEGEEALKATSPLWREYDPSTLGKEHGLEYHPAAIAFYESLGN
ncbi:MAG: TAXI family TRAP transporter solute-binding subunit [Pseudomonadota bacterium]